MIPNFNGPIGRTGKKYTFVKGIPFDSLNRQLVRLVRGQNLVEVLLRRLVDHAVLARHQHCVVQFAVEIETCSFEGANKISIQRI